MAMTQQPRHPKWDAFKRSFNQSNYITDFWNWFLTLLSKSAELVLFGSILYSSYQLIPGVQAVPPAIDAVLFLIQQAALDIGGMGLLKLAKRAGLPQNSFPMRVGVTLVALMIANVVLATIKHALPMIPESIFVLIEALLLIARAVMAVLFGHAIHALREDYGDSTLTIKDTNALQQRLDQLAIELAQTQHAFQEQVTHVNEQLSSELAQVKETFQEQLSAELSKVKETFQEQLSAELAQVKETFQEQLSSELSRLQEDVHQYQPMLAIFPQLETQLQFIPHLQAKLQQIENVTVEELRRVHIPLEKQTQSPVLADPRPVLRALSSGRAQTVPSTPDTRPPGTKERPQSAQQGSPSGGKFDARAFVFSCLEMNMELKLSEIEQYALTRGHDISQPTISRYRKQFFSHRESSTIAVDESSSLHVEGVSENTHTESESALDERKALGE